MEILDTTAACFSVDEDLLNFDLDAEGEEEDSTIFKGAAAVSSSSLGNPGHAVAAAVFGRSVPFPPVSSTLLCYLRPGPPVTRASPVLFPFRVGRTGVTRSATLSRLGWLCPGRLVVGSNFPARLNRLWWICVNGVTFVYVDEFALRNPRACAVNGGVVWAFEGSLGN